MSGKELLENHPKSALVVKQHFLKVMLDSLNDESLPEDFKDAVRQAGIDNDKIGRIIDASPRALYDVFDGHKLYAETIVDAYGGFWWKIGETQSTIGYEYRVNCDVAAISELFKLLEAKL